MKKQAYQRDPLTWQMYILLAFYGYLMNILGPLTPYLRAEHHTNYTTAGYHFSLFAVGMLIAGTFGEHVSRRLGAMRTLWLSMLASFPGILFILLAKTVWLSLAGAFFTGLMASFILTTVPGLLAYKYGDQQAVAFTEINAFASLVCIFAPLLAGGLASSVFGWRGALVLPYLILAVYAVWQRKSIREGFATRFQLNSETTAAKMKPLPWIYWLAWLSILLVVAIEFCMVYWSSDFLISALGVPENLAALSVSLFLAAMLVSRFIGSRILKPGREKLIYNLALLFVTSGFLLFWLSGLVWLKGLGLFLTGFGVGNLYPITLTFSLKAAGNELTETASARASLASGGAVLTLPLLLGVLADMSDIQTAYGLVLGLIVFAFALPKITRRLQQR